MTDTITLPDGRTIGYDITGDPAGPPVFYFHGWPASRLEAALVPNPPVRLIAMDRPGYGASTPQPRRRLTDWPADVAALADRLGLRRFHVVGVSGGAPYALVCAARLPQVLGAALISPMPPLAGPGTPPAEALGEGLLRMQRLGRHWRAAWLVMAAMRQGTRFGLFKPHKVIDAASNPRDAACLTPALRRDLIAAWREGLRTGVSGAVSDARIYATGWGFDFTAITAPVSIWHGSADIVIPPATLCAWDGMTAQRHVLEGEGHYSLALTRTPDVIAGLIV